MNTPRSGTRLSVARRISSGTARAPRSESACSPSAATRSSTSASTASSTAASPSSIPTRTSAVRRASSASPWVALASSSKRSRTWGERLASADRTVPRRSTSAPSRSTSAETVSYQPEPRARSRARASTGAARSSPLRPAASHAECSSTGSSSIGSIRSQASTTPRRLRPSSAVNRWKLSSASRQRCSSGTASSRHVVPLCAIASVTAARTLTSGSPSIVFSTTSADECPLPPSASAASLRPSASRDPSARLNAWTAFLPYPASASTAALRNPTFSPGPSASTSPERTAGEGAIAVATEVASLRTRQSSSPSAFISRCTAPSPPCRTSSAAARRRSSGSADSSLFSTPAIGFNAAPRRHRAAPAARAAR